MKNSNETESIDPEQLAGFWVRILAFNTDLIIFLVLGYSAGFFIADNVMFFWVCAAIAFLYDWLFTTSSFRGTPGKRLNKIEVINARGTTLSPGRSFIRTLSKILSFAFLFGGFTMIAFHKRKQGLHDLISGAYVKHRHR